jgi:hypothetical protein
LVLRFIIVVVVIVVVNVTSELRSAIARCICLVRAAHAT